MKGSTRVARATLYGGTALLLLAGASACDDAELKGAKAEVAPHKVELDMPPPPKFDIPQADGDVHPARELRLLGNKLLKTDIKVKGYVTWIYDCVAALRGPDMSVKETLKLIEAQKSKCKLPHFYLGDKPDDTRARSIMVAEVPRKPFPFEKKKRQPPPNPDEEPPPKPPTISVGDEVIVSGKWTKSSGRSTSLQGLLLYADLENLTLAAKADDPEKKK